MILKYFVRRHQATIAGLSNKSGYISIGKIPSHPYFCTLKMKSICFKTGNFLKII
ncbi:MAG: hypothetical protein JWR72_2837 [Flavisolibacter sp.]|jgi:hypothetical protein|nr:hypothetical protein [Flavisolibacter sp.]